MSSNTYHRRKRSHGCGYLPGGLFYGASCPLTYALFNEGLEAVGREWRAYFLPTASARVMLPRGLAPRGLGLFPLSSSKQQLLGGAQWAVACILEVLAPIRAFDGFLV